MRRDHTDLIAISISLLLHGACMYWMANRADPSLFANQAVARRQQPTQTRLLVDSAYTPKPVETPKPIPAPEPPPPPPKPIPSREEIPEPPPMVVKSEPIIPPELKPMDTPPPPVRVSDGFGELTGEADATSLHSLTGDQAMQASKAEHDQPLIRQDPGGNPSLVRKKDAQPKQEQVDTPTVPPQPAVVEAKATPETIAKRPEERPAALPKPLPEAQTTLRGPLAEAPEKSVPPSPLIALDTKAGTRPRAARPGVLPATQPVTPKADEVEEVESSGSGDIAPAADSDSDPFSSVGAVEFRAGKVVAHFGRKVKTVKPRLSLAGQYDLMSLPNPAVVVKISVDNTGRVRDVKVVKSSGSSEVDQPCQLAIYDWWFEPPHDKSGRPLATELVWTLQWRTY